MEYTSERLIEGVRGCEQDSDVFKEHIERYRFAISFIKSLKGFDKGNGIKVLDIACGSGYGSAMMAEVEGVREVWGGDISEEAIKMVEEKYGKRGDQGNQGDKGNRGDLCFKVMSATDLPFEDDYFDAMVSFETIEHVREFREFRDEILRVLKPGGLLILSTPNKKATKKLGIKNVFHVKEFTIGELRELFRDVGDLKVFGQRPLKKLTWRQRLMKWGYLWGRRLGLLGRLGKLVADDSRKKIGREIEGLEKDFEVREIGEIGCLYLIIVGINKK